MNQSTRHNIKWTIEVCINNLFLKIMIQGILEFSGLACVSSCIFICAMVKPVAFFGDGRPPTFNDGILIMGPYKPLRTWVDEFIPYYM